MSPTDVYRLEFYTNYSRILFQKSSFGYTRKIDFDEISKNLFIYLSKWNEYELIIIKEKINHLSLRL